MRMLAPLGTVLLTASLWAPAVHAQDSPIIINDNGNIPLQNQSQVQTQAQGGRRKAPPKAKKRSRLPPSGSWSQYETHINHSCGAGIQHNYINNEFLIKYKNYLAVSLDTPDGHHLDLKNEAPWTLTLQPDQTKIKSGGNDHKDNNHIHIDPAPGMKLDPPWDMDHPDPNDMNGTATQLTGIVFDGAVTKNTPYSGNSFTIHYCGPSGCTGDCFDLNQSKKK